VQATGQGFDGELRALPRPGLRHVTIFFSDIAGFSDFTRKHGDIAAGELIQQLLALQEIIITRDDLGQVLQFGGDSIFAVFSHASVALNRALEIQRVLAPAATAPCNGASLPQVRIGLHMGEVLVKEGERLEVISRHVNRAHRVMEAALPGQVLASEAVVDAARDFLDIPREHQAISHFGEYYLKGVGATSICEVADSRFRTPERPPLLDEHRADSALISRLELSGYTAASRLGEGSSGVVYRAQQESTGLTVAVKVLNPTQSESPAARERFAREVERTRELNLSGVARVLEHRLDHQPPFFVMELVEGRPLDVGLEGASAGLIAHVFREIC